MNSLAQTPAHVKRHFEQFAAQRLLDTRLQIMVPGDSWDSAAGFRLQEQDYFENREAHLQDYAASVSDKLDDYYAREGKVTISLEAMQKFVAGLRAIAPWWLRRRLRGEQVLVVARNAREERGFAIDFCSGVVTQVSPDEFPRYDVRAEFPALVLLQSIRMNMFSQAWISKRVHYHATRAKLGVLARFLNVLELWEAELLPIGNLFTPRTWRAWLPRWREPLLYVVVVLHRLRGASFLEIERQLLGVEAPVHDGCQPVVMHPD